MASNIHRPGTRVRFQHNGPTMDGTVVRYDHGDRLGGQPFYVIDVNRPESAKVPAHKVKATPNPFDIDEAVSSTPCPSCNPATRKECDTCSGSGFVAGGESRCWSCGAIKVKGRCPVAAKDCGRNNARRKYDLRGESATSALIDAVLEESADDVVTAFHSIMAERVQSKLKERVSLEELYLDSSEHPEVKELIRRGFRLKKSRGDRDVLEGPGGERRVIKRKNGKVHVVREGTHQTIWDESGEQVGYYGPAGEPSEQGEFIWGHTPSGVVGHSRSLEAAKERLKQTHFAHVGQEVPLREETVNEVSDKTLRSYVDKAIDSHADHVLWTRERRRLASKAHQKGELDSSDYHDEEGYKNEHRADKRKEGILRATKKLTKEEQELFEDPFLTPAKLHKYISFGREDLFNAERSKRDDLNRAIRHEDEAGEAKNDEDRTFHNERAKKFSQSAAMTDKAIALRKKGLSTAAKRLLKSGGAPR